MKTGILLLLLFCYKTNNFVSKYVFTFLVRLLKMKVELFEKKTDDINLNRSRKLMRFLKKYIFMGKNKQLLL